MSVVTTLSLSLSYNVWSDNIIILSYNVCSDNIIILSYNVCSDNIIIIIIFIIILQADREMCVTLSWGRPGQWRPAGYSPAPRDDCAQCWPDPRRRTRFDDCPPR